MIRLGELRQSLLEKAAATPRAARPAPARRSPVLETVTRVLEEAVHPMRTCEIYAAANAFSAVPLRWGSVKEALSAYTRGRDRRFLRVRRGVYQLRRS
jgi:hypothetical protein